MKYKIETAGNYYYQEQQQHIEKLKQLGFSFTEKNEYGTCKIEDDKDVWIEIENINDINKLVKDIGRIIIGIDNDYIITIFDDYLD